MSQQTAVCWLNAGLIRGCLSMTQTYLGLLGTPDSETGSPDDVPGTFFIHGH